MFNSGMGSFTVAYDLFIIGVVMSILKTEGHPSALAVGLVTSTALLASAFGAVIFSRIADMLGRKRIYGYECWSWLWAPSRPPFLLIFGG